MTRNLQSVGHLRPVDLARRHGLSTQAIRNYEAAGILPAAQRSSHGYRTYTRRHTQALRAFLALVPGHGHQTATSIMQAINRGTTDDALALIDSSHAELLDDRRTLQAVEAALRDLGPGPPERGDTFIGPLARRLGIRPATLRKWECAGVVQPRRDPQTGYRVYSAADVRDALLAHQLRRGGYRLEQIAPLIDQVRSAGGVAPVASMLRDWHAPPLGQGRRHAHRRRRAGRLPRPPHRVRMIPVQVGVSAVWSFDQTARGRPRKEMSSPRIRGCLHW